MAEPVSRDRYMTDEIPELGDRICCTVNCVGMYRDAPPDASPPPWQWHPVHQGTHSVVQAVAGSEFPEGVAVLFNAGGGVLVWAYAHNFRLIERDPVAPRIPKWAQAMKATGTLNDPEPPMMTREPEHAAPIVRVPGETPAGHQPFTAEGEWLYANYPGQLPADVRKAQIRAGYTPPGRPDGKWRDRANIAALTLWKALNIGNDVATIEKGDQIEWLAETAAIEIGKLQTAASEQGIVKTGEWYTANEIYDAIRPKSWMQGREEYGLKCAAEWICEQLNLAYRKGKSHSPDTKLIKAADAVVADARDGGGAIPGQLAQSFVTRHLINSLRDAVTLGGAQAEANATPEPADMEGGGPAMCIDPGTGQNIGTILTSPDWTPEVKLKAELITERGRRERAERKVGELIAERKTLRADKEHLTTVQAELVRLMKADQQNLKDAGDELDAVISVTGIEPSAVEALPDGKPSTVVAYAMQKLRDQIPAE